MHQLLWKIKHGIGLYAGLIPAVITDSFLTMDGIQYFSRRNVTNGLAYSEPVYPSPWMNPDAEGWEEAYAQAKAFVSQLTLLEKVNLTTGVG